MSEFYKCIFCGACENDEDEPIHAWLCEPVIGDDDVGVKWFVECGRCGARGSIRSSRQEAIETWNSINRIFTQTCVDVENAIKKQIPQKPIPYDKDSEKVLEEYNCPNCDAPY